MDDRHGVWFVLALIFMGTFGTGVVIGWVAGVAFGG